MNVSRASNGDRPSLVGFISVTRICTGAKEIVALVDHRLRDGGISKVLQSPSQRHVIRSRLKRVLTWEAVDLIHAVL